MSLPAKEGEAPVGRGCLVVDRRGKVLLGCQCGQRSTSLYPRRLVRYVCAVAGSCLVPVGPGGDAGGGRADPLVSQFRLLMALRELSGGAMLTQIGVGASMVHVVACARFLVAIIPHAGAASACDLEVLHFAHMLQLLYPVELGARKRKAEK